jgi:hypothetical protein
MLLLPSPSGRSLKEERSCPKVAVREKEEGQKEIRQAEEVVEEQGPGRGGLLCRG